MTLLAFTAVALGIIVIPGPNVLVIVATTLAHGRARGLQAVLGASCAMVVQLALAGLATSVMVLLAQGLMWLKWLGVAYLVYLGLRSLMTAAVSETPCLSANGSFWRGFLVSLTNPKTCLFFAAFLPQFVDPRGSYAQQIFVLSSIFWVLALACDTGYALVAGRMASMPALARRSVKLQRLAGGTLLGAGAALAMTRITRHN